MLFYNINKVLYQLRSISFFSLFFLLAFTVFPAESVHSAVTKQLDASWEYIFPPPEELAGFRLYQDGNIIHQVDDPLATHVTIDIPVGDVPISFTMTAFDVNNNESLHSDALTYTPTPTSGDSDGDGLADDIDPCPNDAANDADNDGVCADVDQCPGFNDTLDSDDDGIADGCDTCPYDADNDADNDGVCGNVDKCPGFNDTMDSDNDGIVDGCDSCPNDRIEQMMPTRTVSVVM